ncbi:MAG: FecR family protein [Azonexaceae bacterium]|uniref:FecR family protein n=1 Tax=Azonexus sp. R2A61 TaxID=2744443 RepID=UPI001F3B0788|nr:FecR domain-containing protein [Azonexus sp. R2A61]MCE1238503.1 FecR family protein [Azonexaceae bacterium]
MNKNKWIVGLCLLPMLALADQPVGFVKTVSGEASVTSEGKAVTAEVGTPVFAGSVLRTGRQAAMGVTFKDETVMSFGPNTELTVSEYLYAPGQGKLRLGSKLTKGSLNYVSGVIAKLKPDAVTLETPTGTIGVRGTQFLVKVEE